MAPLLFQPDDRLAYNAADGSVVPGTVRGVDDWDVLIKFDDHAMVMTYKVGTSGYARLSLVSRNPFDLAEIS